MEYKTPGFDGFRGTPFPRLPSLDRYPVFVGRSKRLRLVSRSRWQRGRVSYLEKPLYAGSWVPRSLTIHFVN